jgi:hypothetical protein
LDEGFVNGCAIVVISVTEEFDTETKGIAQEGIE